MDYIKSDRHRYDFIQNCPELVIVDEAHTCAFGYEGKGGRQLRFELIKERDTLETLFREGPVFIDAPIDLQGLPDPESPSYVWQLTKRPVDLAFNALPALADRIGACTSRIRHLIRNLPSECLGEQLFETYPAASLELMNLNNKGYKGGKGAVFRSSQWNGISDSKKDASLAHLLNELRWRGSSDMEINDDEFDAAICAVTGIMPRTEWLHDDKLAEMINEKLRTGRNDNTPYSGPRGYVLLKGLPSVVRLNRE